MALAFRIKARARREIEQAAQWWSEHRPAAPGAIRLEVEQALAILVEQPGIGTRVASSQPSPVRRFLLGRTGHFLYYRVRGKDLEVLSLWHSSRERGPAVTR